MKDTCKIFVDMILENCQYKEKEEFEESKVIIEDLLTKKTDGLLDAVIENNKEMYFTLLTIDNPGDHDLDYWEKLQEFFKKMIRFEVINSDYLGYKENRDSKEKEEAKIKERERDELLLEFCKMFVVGQKMTQEICRLIIYLTSKNI